MLLHDPVQSQEIWKMILADKAHQAEMHRLARQTGTRRQMAVQWQLRWLLCSVGYGLVALGARLEAYALAPYQAAKIANNGTGNPGCPCGSAC